MTKTFATAAIAAGIIVAGLAGASACNYNTGYTSTYTPVYTQTHQTYVPAHNTYNYGY